LVAFWGWGILGQVLVTLGVTFLMQLIGYFVFKDVGLVRIIQPYGILFLSGYLAFISVAIWRSANNYEGLKIWGILSKLLIIIRWLGILWGNFII